MDSALFELWFEDFFIPEIPTSSTIVLGNASFHRKSKLYPLAQKYGHKIISLPPYSPNLNQIENFWAWLKGKIKKVVHMFDDFDEALCYCFGVV
ncbi:MAG: transposase [Defluviitaleaceae bacterium]|nr:transposase [Defluviitaleaceae bacterium]